MSTVVFSVLNAALFRPPPHVADPGALVHVFRSTPRFDRGPHSFPEFLDYGEMTQTLEDVAAVGSRRFSVGRVAEGTRQMHGQPVSANDFQLLGIPLIRGRGFLPEDVDAGGRVVVIGYNTWQREFDGAPDAVGRDLHLNGQLYTVVGVGPVGMVAHEGPLLSEIAVPIMDFRDRRGRAWLNVVGRRKAGMGMRQVQAEFTSIASQLLELYPDDWDPRGNSPGTLRVVSSQDARIPSGAPLAAGRGTAHSLLRQAAVRSGLVVGPARSGCHKYRLSSVISIVE